MKLLIVGANGMLGNACMNYFSSKPNYEVTGTVRSKELLSFFPSHIKNRIISNIDITDPITQAKIFYQVTPDVVINCVGLVKQAQVNNNPYRSILLNALLPHQLAMQCSKFDSKLLHISTDCVFSGLKGSPYLQSDLADASDLYGKTKYLGEVINLPNALTIRTSYIGNELDTSNGLLEWFLAQSDQCQGFTKAIYSGLPTVILMELFEDILINYPSLSGLYQVASAPISKYNLLMLIAQVFQKRINIVPNDSLLIDRSLDGSIFQGVTGFIAPSWELMIKRMYLDRIANVQK